MHNALDAPAFLRVDEFPINEQPSIEGNGALVRVRVKFLCIRPRHGDDDGKKPSR